MGILIGSRKDNTVTITDAIPLFHDHIFTSMLEVAMEMVDSVVEEGTIVGIYDAPVRPRASNETKITAVSSQVAEQIVKVKGQSDAVCLSI